MAELGDHCYYQPLIGTLPEACDTEAPPQDEAELSRLWTVLYNYLTSYALATIYEDFPSQTVMATLAQIIQSCASEQLLDHLLHDRGDEAPGVLARFVIDLALKKLQSVC